MMMQKMIVLKKSAKIKVMMLDVVQVRQGKIVEKEIINNQLKNGTISLE